MNQISKWERHSSTTANIDLTAANNGTWMDAWRFGESDDFTWTLNGQDFELDVQRNRYDAQPLLSCSTGNGRIIVDDVIQRVIHMNVPAADIQAHLIPGFYVYDLVMVDTDSRRVPLMFGSLEIVQGVTYP